jgi:hypothetical protein
MDFTSSVNPDVSSRPIPAAAPQRRGTLTQAQVDRVLRSAFPKALQCYKAENVDQKVEIVIDFVIAADGTVFDAQPVSSTHRSKVFEGCIKNAVLALQFPVPEGNGVVLVTTPFTFYP